MSNIIELEFPARIDRSTAHGLVDQLQGLDDVDGSEVETYRAVDPVTLTAWVNLVAAAIPAVTAIVRVVRESKLRRVRIRVGEAVIEADSATPEQIAALVGELNKDD